MTLREIWNRLAFWGRRERLERELAREMESHVEMLARDFEAEGMSPTEARAAAHKRIGNITGLREGSRDYWGFPAIETIVQDVRYALRGLRRAPGFTATVIVTLGLGIGANAAMFSVVDQLMFRPISLMRDPAAVNRVYLQYLDRGQQTTDWSMEFTRYLDLRKWTSSFSQYAAFTERSLAVGSGADVRQVHVATVSAGYFDFFDARPALGRWFTTAEDSTPRGAEVAVLGYNYWMTQYGGDSSVIGKRVQIDNFSCTIIGVAPKGLSGVQDNYQTAIYVPITTFAGSNANADDAAHYFTRYNWGWMEMMVRRKPGVAIAAASADLSQAYIKSWNAEGAQEKVTPVDVAKPRAFASAIRIAGGPDPSLEARTSLWTIGVAGIVLLIACANVANLFLARALRRRREIAMRIALGSSRARLAAQCVTESLVLALAAGVAGALIAQVGGATLRAMFVAGDEPHATLTDWRTVGFALAAATIAGLLTGVAPAILGGRGELASTLKAGAREGTYSRSRLRTTLLVAQGALSVLLLVGAGLFVRSLQHARAIRIGYDAEPVLLAYVNARGQKPPNDTAVLALGHRLDQEARAIPGVDATSWVSSVPFISSSSTSLFVTGIDSIRKLGRFTYVTATPGYFDAMGTRIIRGRAFGDADRGGAPLVAVVSENMARALWPGRDALGQCMRVGQDTMPCTTVIGIAENAAQRRLSNDPQLRYYLPADQRPRATGFALLVKTHGDPAKLAEVVRKRLQPLMPGAAYVTTGFMRDIVDQQRRSWQFGATVFVALGMLALVVAGVGLYGVISYNVAQRTHELGVRIALGAQSRDVVRLVVGQGLMFAASGAAIGLSAAYVAGKWIQPLLFNEPARDPVAFSVVGLMMIAIGVVASALPSLRATRADPNLALRSE